MKERFLTVKQLVEKLGELKAKKLINDDTIVVLSADSEGNHFGCPTKNLEYSFGLDYDLSYGDEELGSNLVIYPMYEYLTEEWEE
jgi:hypothetical protein